MSAPTFYEHSPGFTQGLFASDNGGPDSQTRSAIGGFPCRVRRAMMAAVDAPRHVRRRCVIGVEKNHYRRQPAQSGRCRDRINRGRLSY